MKKSTFFMNIGIVVLIAIVVIGFTQPGNITDNNSIYSPVINKSGNKISELINSKRTVSGFKDYSLFTHQPKTDNSKALNEFVRDGSFMTLRKSDLNRILSEKSDNISLTVPTSDNSQVSFELTRVNILSKDFKIIDDATGKLSDFTGRALYYQGIIKGDNNSFAAISFFDDFVMGIVADMNGNYVLGSMKDNNHTYTDNYVYYNDKNILKQKPFNCRIGDNEEKYVMHHENGIQGVAKDNIEVSPDTVNVFFDTDNQMYLDAQGNSNNVIAYVSGFFNGVSAIYASESIPFNISRIGIATSTDPYINIQESDQILSKFGENTKDNFMGDLAHLLSTGHGGLLGGIAWIDVLCQPATNQQGTWVGRFAFSNIDTSYNNYPVYSWTVNVVTHEMGHNLGSYHTHACHWRYPNGSIGPIDTCIVTGENASPSFGGQGCINSAPLIQCYQSNNPFLNGFTMSYCHFCVNSGGGIMLINGFGRPFGSFWSQSGDTVREKFQHASCLHQNLNSSEAPVNFVLLQNYPNPYNPSTNIKFALPQEGSVTLIVYDINGREVTHLIDSKYYAVGIFSVTFDASLYKLASGVYFYKLRVDNNSKQVYSEIKKMVLVK